MRTLAFMDTVQIMTSRSGSKITHHCIESIEAVQRWALKVIVNHSTIDFSSAAFHHYIKGHISVFSRGFICFCCLEPNFLHGVSCPYSPEYWRASSVIPQKNWGVWTHFLIFDPFYWLEKQPACDKSCIETAFECSFSFWNSFNLSAYGLFLHDMSEEHIVPKLA